MKYFIEDTTTNRLAKFDTIPLLLSYMEEVCERKFKKNRKEWMQDMQDLGNVINPNPDVAFVEAISSEFQLGIIRPNGQKVVCDIYRALYNSQRKESLGN